MDQLKVKNEETLKSVLEIIFSLLVAAAVLSTLNTLLGELLGQ